MQVLRELTPLLRIEGVLGWLQQPCSDKKTRQVKDLFRLLQQESELADRELARALFGKTRAANHPPFIALVEEITWASLQETLEPRGRHVNHPTRHESMIRCDRMQRRTYSQRMIDQRCTAKVSPSAPWGQRQKQQTCSKKQRLL
jgi:hypothetical protein